ncbi:myb-like DNA-binding protein bas1 [Vanrija albida]|uniref:Myb-like DNA-binding protein bas1 n=1 Tax=Vanrija albida TaxID=181172 RepID=A0ABR3QCB7_9TREE
MADSRVSLPRRPYPGPLQPPTGQPPPPPVTSAAAAAVAGPNPLSFIFDHPPPPAHHRSASSLSSASPAGPSSASGSHASSGASVLSASTAATTISTASYAESMSSSSAVAPGVGVGARRRRRWTQEEDDALITAVGKYGCARGPGSQWSKISEGLPGRTNKDCRKRWFHSLDPAVRKGKWSAEEDDSLRRLYAEMGPQWKEIALRIPGRKDDQVSKRWRDVLAPELTAKKPWSGEEDQLLLELLEQLGPRWTAIADKLPGRSPIACRNRSRKYRSVKTDGDSARLDGEDIKLEDPDTYQPHGHLASAYSTSNHDPIVGPASASTHAGSVRSTTEGPGSVHEFEFEFDFSAGGIQATPQPGPTQHPPPPPPPYGTSEHEEWRLPNLGLESSMPGLAFDFGDAARTGHTPLHPPGSTPSNTDDAMGETSSLLRSFAHAQHQHNVPPLPSLHTPAAESRLLEGWLANVGGGERAAAAAAANSLLVSPDTPGTRGQGMYDSPRPIPPPPASDTGSVAGAAPVSNLWSLLLALDRGDHSVNVSSAFLRQLLHDGGTAANGPSPSTLHKG